jgi:hypothetical protein
LDALSKSQARRLKSHLFDGADRAAVHRRELRHMAQSIVLKDRLACAVTRWRSTESATAEQLGQKLRTSAKIKNLRQGIAGGFGGLS